jgi:hypothetical protein
MARVTSRSATSNPAQGADVGWPGRCLTERVLALHEALARHGVPHAFTGAIALAYWTRDPRPTSDIDISVFAPATETAAAPALSALPVEVGPTGASSATIERDGMCRLWWDRTPIDLFFGMSALTLDASRNARVVAFAGTRIPVLGPVELAMHKAMFDRASDWLDIEAMLAAGTLDRVAYERALRLGSVRRTLRRPRSWTARVAGHP